MENVVPLYQKWHVLFLEDDWVIRHILIEHFALDKKCHAVSFAHADKALSYLRAKCGGERIFSNIRVGSRGGIDLSSEPDRRSHIELAIAPGYDTEDDRFHAIKADLGFFRVKRYDYRELRQLVRQGARQSSIR